MNQEDAIMVALILAACIVIAGLVALVRLVGG